MKRSNSRKQGHLEFFAKLGGSSVRLRLQKPSKQISAHLLRWLLVLGLALLILFMPQLWQAIQVALSIIHK
mgnify:CR=1 FL=1